MTNLEYLPWQGTTAGFGGLQAAMLAAIVLRRGAAMEALGADSEGRVQEDNFSLLATGPSSLILDTASGASVTGTQFFFCVTQKTVCQAVDNGPSAWPAQLQPPGRESTWEGQLEGDIGSSSFGRSCVGAAPPVWAPQQEALAFWETAAPF